MSFVTCQFTSCTLTGHAAVCIPCTAQNISHDMSYNARNRVAFTNNICTASSSLVSYITPVSFPAATPHGYQMTRNKASLLGLLPVRLTDYSSGIQTEITECLNSVCLVVDCAGSIMAGKSIPWLKDPDLMTLTKLKDDSSFMTPVIWIRFDEALNHIDIITLKSV